MCQEQETAVLTRFQKYPIALAFISADEPDANHVKELFGGILDILETEPLLSASSDTIPTAAKILQPKDRHIILHEGFATCNEAMETKGEQLYRAQQLFERYELLLSHWP